MTVTSDLLSISDLALSKKDFDLNPSSYRGFIEKRLKRSVDFQVAGKLYTVNTHGVLCSRSILEDGKTWYSFCCTADELFDKRSDEKEFIGMLSVGWDSKGLIFR